MVRGTTQLKGHVFNAPAEEDKARKPTSALSIPRLTVLFPRPPFDGTTRWK